MSGINHPMFGKKHSYEAKKRISESGIGRKSTKESIEKRLKTLKNNNKTSILKGRTLSDEDKLKKSIAALNKVKITCPYCNITTDPGNIARWHLEKCKKFILVNLEQSVDEASVPLTAHGFYEHT